MMVLLAIVEMSSPAKKWILEMNSSAMATVLFHKRGLASDTGNRHFLVDNVAFFPIM